MSREVCVKVRDGIVFLPGISADSLYDIDRQIEDLKNQIKNAQEHLCMLAASTPKDVANSEDGDIINQLQDRVQEVVEIIGDCNYELCKLGLLKDIVDDYSSGRLKLVEGTTNHYEYDNTGFDVNNQYIFKAICSGGQTPEEEEWFNQRRMNILKEAKDIQKETEEWRKKSIL